MKMANNYKLLTAVSITIIELIVKCKSHSVDELEHCSLSNVVVDLVDKVTKLQLEVKYLNKQLLDLQSSNSSSSQGSIYIRWGRNVCPEDALLIYNGYTAGKQWNDPGSGSDTICLPANPSWAKYKDSDESLRGYIYGTEIDTNEPSEIFQNTVNEQDMPCVVCRSKQPSILMIPARNSCFPGWKLEYQGYLMSANHGYSGPYNHICMDGEPEFLPNGSANNNQHILYLVEARCGSLPCPPYVQGRELACVVCSI